MREGHDAPGPTFVAFAALAAAIVLLVCFGGIWVHPLSEPDEGRYGEIAREMATSGDVVLTRLSGIRYLEKPPGYFWTAALAILALGPTETAPRLPSALATVLTAALTGIFGARAFGRRTGAMAAIVLVTMPLTGAFSRLAMVDPLLTACTTLATVGALEAARGGGFRANLLFWAGLGLGALVKGPIAIALPGVGAATYAAATQDLAFVRALALPGGPLLFTAIVTPWLVAVERADPGALRTFLLEQNVHRLVAGERFARDAPPWFYLLLLPLVTLPWLPFAPALWRHLRGSVRAALSDRESLRGAGPTPAHARRRGRIFLACAFLAPLLLLSVAHSKLVYYLLPLMPPIAILLADAIVGEEPGEADVGPDGPRSRWPARAFGGLTIVLALGIVAGGFAWLAPDTVQGLLPRGTLDSVRLPKRLFREAAILRAAGGATVLLAAVALGLGITARILAARGRLPGAVALGVTLAVGQVAWPWVASPAGNALSARSIALAAEPLIDRDDGVLLFRTHLRGVPYYLERECLLWDARLAEFGREPTPAEARGFALQRDTAELAQLWRGERRWVAIVGDAYDRAGLEEIVGAEHVRELARVGEVSIVENRPARGGEGGRPAPAHERP